MSLQVVKGAGYERRSADGIGGGQHFVNDGSRRYLTGSGAVDYKKYVEKEKEDGKLCRVQLWLQ